MAAPVSASWLGAHVPWAQVEAFLPLVLELGLAPEIAVKGPELDTLDPAQIARLQTQLAATGRRPTVHAPFFDLNPGALDPLLQQAAAQRLTQALDLATELGAHLMVVHPGYDRWRYPGLADAWLEQAARFFPPLLARAAAAGCRLALENIYEETPATLAGLVDRLASPWFGHCFDAGHWQLFGTQPMTDWLADLGPQLFHLHLHDNHGMADDHLPLGEGRIDFTPLLAHLAATGLQPSMTLEAHAPDSLRRSLARARDMIQFPPRPA